MREPGNNLLKAWSRDYNEAPFYFGQKFDQGSRLIAWTEEPEMIKAAFYRILESMSAVVFVKVKICSEKSEDGKIVWTVYQGKLAKNTALDTIRLNEKYVFSDGMHQLWIKDFETKRYLVFEDHGVFNLYFPNSSDEELFHSLGFQKRFADPIFSIPHFHCVGNSSETIEMKFVSEMGLQFISADSDQ
jgi:hypothetical protein